MSNGKFQRDQTGGALFPLEEAKRRPNGPAMEGPIEIMGAEAQYIAQQIAATGRAELRLSAWSKVGQQNKRFLTLSAEIPWADNPRNTKRQQSGGYAQQSQGTPPPYAAPQTDNDEIPF